mmetsp:Transcript_25545/g.35127  ORF Transcript_25545/g.35127 Transcript_25545/m.35127 type:complete len:338 (+) Transcript_25545:442-1455(+)
MRGWDCCSGTAIAAAAIPHVVRSHNGPGERREGEGDGLAVLPPLHQVLVAGQLWPGVGHETLPQRQPRTAQHEAVAAFLQDLLAVQLATEHEVHGLRVPHQHGDTNGPIHPLRQGSVAATGGKHQRVQGGGDHQPLGQQQVAGEPAGHGLALVPRGLAGAVAEGPLGLPGVEAHHPLTWWSEVLNQQVHQEGVNGHRYRDGVAEELAHVDDFLLGEVLAVDEEWLGGLVGVAVRGGRGISGDSFGKGDGGVARRGAERERGVGVVEIGSVCGVEVQHHPRAVSVLSRQVRLEGEGFASCCGGHPVELLVTEPHDEVPQVSLEDLQSHGVVGFVEQHH